MAAGLIFLTESAEQERVKGTKRGISLLPENPVEKEKEVYIVKKLRKVFTLAATLLVIVVAVQQFGAQAEAYVQKLGTITTDTSLYESASSSSSVVMSLTAGQSVAVNNEVTGTDGAIWYQLYVNGTETGYVPSSVVTVTETSSTEADVLTTTTTVTTGTISVSSTVNVRASASTSSSVVTQLASGATFTVTGQETGSDGYVWYEIEVEQNGSTVTGFVRSDLATVKTEEVVVETPAEETEGDTTTGTGNTGGDTTTSSSDNPYRLVSQTNAEGDEVWYLVESGSSTGYAVADLLEAAKTANSTSSSGGSKVVTVILLILLIVAVAGLAFVFLRWREAESTAEELREQSRRRRTTSGPAGAGSARTQSPSAQKPKQPAGAVQQGQNRPGQTTGTQQTAQTRTQQSVQTRTQQTTQARTQTGSSVQPTTQARPQTGSAQPTAQTRTQATGTQQTVRPTAAGSSTQQTSSAAGRTVTPAPRAQQSEAGQDADMKIRTSSTGRPVPDKSQYDKITLEDLENDDFPDTDDIVSTTRRELKHKQDEPAAKPKTRKSRNFLDDDDDEDLEFDFLKLDDDE